MQKKRLIKLAIFAIPLIFIFSQCLNFRDKQDARGAVYAGSQTCVKCHSDICNSYQNTAHFIASLPANAQSILGDFTEGKNNFTFTPFLRVRMEKRDGGFYQTAIEDGQVRRSEPFNVTFGGVKGQSYAYWHNHMLFELPISVDGDKHEWMSSPGYSSTDVFFDRPVGIRCLDCHASYIKQVPPSAKGYHFQRLDFDESTLIYSVDCERCHGPAAAHVKFQTENPQIKTAHYITAIGTLSREQKINMCAICHSGAGVQMFKPTFGFKPTDTLSRYMHAPPTQTDYKRIDVHGNQLELLRTSKCFISSNMDCNSCHDTHVNDKNKPLIYAAKCESCHSQAHNPCKLAGQLSSISLANNCVSCHMPALPSNAIVMNHSGVTVHTHHIAVYPDETNQVLKLIRQKGVH